MYKIGDVTLASGRCLPRWQALVIQPINQVETKKELQKIHCDYADEIEAQMKVS